MLLTADLDAWILAQKMRDEFGFEQSFADLMEHFDMGRFQTLSPINPKTQDIYDARVRELYTSLKTAPVGSIIPLYFIHSKAKTKVIAHYNKKDPHLNTHQTMLASGHADFSFRATQIPHIA